MSAEGGAAAAAAAVDEEEMEVFLGSKLGDAGSDGLFFWLTTGRPLPEEELLAAPDIK